MKTLAFQMPASHGLGKRKISKKAVAKEESVGIAEACCFNINIRYDRFLFDSLAI